MVFLQRAALLLLIIVMLLGAVLRFSAINSASLWIDEGYSIIASQGVMSHGKPFLESGRTYNNWKTDSYLIASTTKIFGFDPYNPWAARIPATIFGLLSILMTYLLTINLFKEKKSFFIALGAAFLSSFLSWQVAWSVQARGYSLAQLSVITTLYFFIKVKPSNSLRSFLEVNKFPLLGITLSVLVGYLTTPLTLLILPALAVFLLTTNTSSVLKKINSAYIKVAFLMLLFVATATFFSVIAQSTILKTGTLATGYLIFLTSTFPALVIGSLAMLLLSLISGEDYKKVIFLTTSFLIPLIILVLYYDTQQFRYLFPFITPIIIMFCCFAYSITSVVVNQISGHFSKRIGQNSVAIGHFVFFLFLIIVLTTPSLHLSPTNVPLLEEGSPQPNFKEAFSVIKNYSDDNSVIISPYPHLHQIYLREKGYAVMTSLSGRKEEIESRLVNPKNCNPPIESKKIHENYVCAPVLQGDDLKNTIENRNGFVILDEMALNHENDDIKIIKNHSNLKLIYHSNKENMGSLWLYQF